MRFVSYRDAGGEGVAVCARDEWRGRGVQELGCGLAGLLARNEGDLRAVAADLIGGEAVDLAAVTLLPPIPRPPKVLCIGLNYADHAAEAGLETPAHPAVFARFATSLVADGAPLIRPIASAMFDYEGELAVVIGRGGRHIAEADALAHVAGYAPFNDGSLRDYQFRSTQWTMGKTFDGTGGFGPELVGADELPPGCAGLSIETRLNGVTVQSASIDEMIFGVARLVSVLSEVMTLEAGDVIATGTPAGIGAARKPPIWMKPGDLCEVEIERVGRLSNPVGEEGAGARRDQDD